MRRSRSLSRSVSTRCSELDALANGMATVLEHRGVRPGERVALMSSNRPEFVVALRAIWRLGASAVLLSPAWKRDRGRARAGADQARARRRGPSGAGRADADAVTGRSRSPPGSATFEAPSPESRRAVRVQFGHDGHAQGGAAHPRRRSPSRCGTGATRCDLTSADRMQIMTPPSHILGLLNIVMALDTGAWMRLHRRFDIDADAAPHRGRPDHHRDGRRANRSGARRAPGARVATTCRRCATSCGARRRSRRASPRPSPAGRV